MEREGVTNSSSFLTLFLALICLAAFGIVMILCAIFAESDKGLFLFLGIPSLAVCYPLFRATAASA